MHEFTGQETCRWADRDHSLTLGGLGGFSCVLTPSARTVKLPGPKALSLLEF